MTRKAKTIYFFTPDRPRSLQKPPCPSQGVSERGPHGTARPLGRSQRSPVPLTGTARPPLTPHGASPAWQPRRSAADRGNAPGIGTAPKRRPKVAGTSRTTRGRAPHPAATPPSITKPAEGGSDPRPAALTPSRPPRPAAAPLPGPPPRSALPQRPPTKWRRLPAPLPASGAGLNACGGAGHGGGR